MFNNPQPEPQPMQGPMSPPPNDEADMALLDGAHSAIEGYFVATSADSSNPEFVPSHYPTITITIEVQIQPRGGN